MCRLQAPDPYHRGIRYLGTDTTVCVSLFLLSGVVNENIKGQFEDENAKFRPLPPVPDTGC